MSDLRVVQLEDGNHNPITPYTAASSVYVNVGGEWTNVETKIGAMNIDAVQEAQESALDSIDEQRVITVNKIVIEGDSYRSDIDALSGTVKTLDEKVFPLTIETGITGNTSTLKNTYKYSIKEYGQLARGINVVVKWKSNGLDDVIMYSGSDATKTITSGMTWGRDTYTVTCVKGDKSNSKTDKMYLCVYGAGGETVNNAIITGQMSRKQTTSATFTCTVGTSTEKPYIWIAVPQYLSISKITSGGFDVTMNQYVNVAVGDINYRAYRSKNPLQIAQWELSVIQN